MDLTHQSRFYSCSINNPFLTVIDKDFHVSDDDYVVTVTSEVIEEFKEKKKYIVSGEYQYTSKNTFFRKFETRAISSDRSAVFNCVVETEVYPGIFPKPVGDDVILNMRTITVVMQVSRNDYSDLKKTLSKPENSVDAADRDHLFNVVKCGGLDVASSELEHSKRMSSFLSSFLGSKYTVMNNNTLLGIKNPYCRYSTSQPDIAFFHKFKFVKKGRVVCGASFDPDVQLPGQIVPQDQDMLPAEASSLPKGLIDQAVPQAPCSPQPPTNLPQSRTTVVGDGGEDKISGLAGEAQAIAAMNIVGTKLTMLAAARGDFCDQAIIFGHVRATTNNDMVTPYKMHTDYVERATTVYKGPAMNTSEYLNTVKYYLDHLEEL